MALPNSPEFPSFLWGGPPRAYGSGRDGKAVRYLTVHYTAGAEGRTSAENGAAYDKVRTDGTSCHAFADADTVVQEVLTRDRSNSAFSKGNRLGVHLEICGTLQTRGQWLDPTSDATLWQAARFAAAVCDKYSLPVRRMTVDQVRRAWYSFPGGADTTGICGHVDITRAYPEDGGTHTDPGPEFPWDVFLTRTQFLLSGGAMALPTEQALNNAVAKSAATFDLLDRVTLDTDQAAGIQGGEFDVPSTLAIKAASRDAAAAKRLAEEALAAVTAGGSGVPSALDMDAIVAEVARRLSNG